MITRYKKECKMITKSMPLLMLLMSILCSSCTEDSSSTAKVENIITKSKTKPEHYIPMDAENTYKYILSSSIIEKPSYTETTYYNIIEMSVWSGQYFTLNYAIDTNWANYFGRDRYYRNGTKISEVFYKMGLDYTTFHFAIDNDGLAIKNLLIDTTYTDTVHIADEVYPCVAIVEKNDAGLGRCTTYFAKGIGAVKYRYTYEDKDRIKLSDMILMSCEVK